MPWYVQWRMQGDALPGLLEAVESKRYTPTGLRAKAKPTQSLSLCDKKKTIQRVIQFWYLVKTEHT